MTAEEAQELEKLERRCWELTEFKGITDTVHHDRLAALRLKAGGGGQAEHTKEGLDDGTGS